MEDVVNLLLNIDGQVDIAHNGDLEDFLSAIGDDGEYEVVVKMKELLIKEEDGV